MKTVKFERRLQLPENHRRIGCESAGPGLLANKHSGEAHWDCLVSQVQVLPLSRPQPISCIESNGLESLLMQMKRPHKQSTGALPVNKIPPLSVRTVSLPELCNKGIVVTPQQRGILESTPRCFPPSRRWSFMSACNEDTSGGSVTPVSKGYLEKACLRCMARKECVVFCTMETVKRGWLPMQKKAAICVIHSDKEQKETAASAREKVNSAKRNNLDHKHNPRNNDSIYTDASKGNQCNSCISSTEQRSEGFPFKGTTDIRKAFNKEKVGLLENSLPDPIGGFLQDLWGNKTALSSFWPDLIHSDYPHRKECAAPCMSPSLPSEQPRTIGILRTSREILCQTNSAHTESKADLSKMRPGFSSITIAARRVATPASAPPETTPGTCLKHTERALPLNVLDPVVTVDGPSIGRHCKPILRNRKATIIKVTEDRHRHRYSYTEGESGRKTRVPEYRHSYAEGENKENKYSHFCEEGDRRGSSASSSRGVVQSSAHYKVPPESANTVLYLDKSLSFSIHKPERSTVQQVYRSALSLYLNCSSPKETLDGGIGKTNENCLPGPKPTGNSSRVSDNTEINQETSTVPPLNQNGLPPQKHSCVNGIWGIASQSSAAALKKRALCVPAPQTEKQEHHFNYGTSMHQNNFRTLYLNDAHGPQNSSNLNRKQADDQGVASFASLPEQNALARGSSPTGDSLLKGNYCSAVTVTAQAKLQTQLAYQIPHSPVAVSARNSKLFSKMTRDTFDHVTSLGKVSDCEKEDIRQQSTPGVITEHTAYSATRNPGKPNQCVQSETHTDLEDGSQTALTLREALELLRPDFITRSRERVQQLELRALQRRAEQSKRVRPPPGIPSSTANRKRQYTRPHPLSDNLFKPKERTFSGKEMQLRSKRIYKQLPEVKRRKEEEKKKVVSQTNRLRAELFKKKLLDQILQRSID
ncbi:(E2-independent) E3 ubiquitin-conjugating enzyme FATS-like [Polyodon spathula]|uniref:(E2-independent) E3 ubiquitin-conjugating enzyme FATS-like n=1 Tax=Polyodon spathula TaxID=7913 RepID=UPI001B7EBEEA|nr:(E2-independent) E3 ubiquitin-conjugating enzyme FATS-like [Polyodon spathula]